MNDEDVIFLTKEEAISYFKSLNREDKGNKCQVDIRNSRSLLAYNRIVAIATCQMGLVAPPDIRKSLTHP